MTMKELLGKELVFTVSEPWEFLAENHGLKIVGRVETASSTALLLRASDPFACAGKRYTLILCTFRHHDTGADSLVRGESVPCNGVAIPNEREALARELDLSWWRGGGGLIGGVELA
jgi:hypothetical protein